MYQLLSLLLINIFHYGQIYGFPCCIIHSEKATCLAEAGSSCTWLDAADPLYSLGQSDGIQCVSKPWVECASKGICPLPPTVPLPAHCVFSACANNEIEYNIAFVIDESGSVGKSNYLASLDFVQNMIENDINELANLSMLAFSSGTDRMYSFTDSQDDQRKGALAALKEERNNYNGGGTCTATALQEVVKEFRTTDFISPSDNNLLFLLTDGYPNCHGDVCDVKMQLDYAGVEVIVVGISGGFSASKVRCLVDDVGDIKTIPKFDEKLFYSLESQLRNVVCPAIYEDDDEQESHLDVT
eukprot:237451_1